MSTRKKVTLGTLPLLGASVAAGGGVVSPGGAPSAVVASLVEYKYSGEDWRCEKFDELVAEFETVTVDQL